MVAPGAKIPYAKRCDARDSPGKIMSYLRKSRFVRLHMINTEPNYLKAEGDQYCNLQLFGE